MNNTLTTLRAALDARDAALAMAHGFCVSLEAENTKLHALITSMEAQPEPSPAMLKVVRGDICCKSLDMDQSYGMWVPVTYSTEHGFVDGTCFYTAPQARKPLTVAQADSLQRSKIIRSALVDYACRPEDETAVALVKAIAHGIEGGAA